MTIEEIFNKLAVHMAEGVMTHNLFTQAYDFLGLYGFAKCHEYHYMDEVKGYTKLLHYYSTHYHKLIMIENVPTPNIIPQTWYKYTTMAVDTSTKRQLIQTLMKKWVEWEQQTKKLYQEMYSELCKINEIAAADKIKCYIQDVSEELKDAEKKLIKFETIDYDINMIIDWQQSIYKKFKKQLK